MNTEKFINQTSFKIVTGYQLFSEKGLKVGNVVQLKDPAGNLRQTQAGSFRLKDGETVSVDRSGKITAIDLNRSVMHFKGYKNEFTRIFGDPSDKELQLKDGTRVIALGGLKIGSTVLTLDPSGIEVPLITGDHELMAGTKIRIIDGGLIDAISKKGALPKPAPPPPSAYRSHSKLLQSKRQAGLNMIQVHFNKQQG